MPSRLQSEADVAFRGRFRRVFCVVVVAVVLMIVHKNRVKTEAAGRVMPSGGFVE